MTALISPRYSVVVPLYNKAAHISDTIDSILLQTVSDFEIIVVDDGSSDNGPAIVRDYALREKRVRLISQANGGVSKARNTGIAEANGEYIAFLDGDDLWAPHLLSEFDALLSAFPHCGAYSTAYAHRYLHGDDQVIEPKFSFSQRRKVHFEYDFFGVASRGELPIMPSCACVPAKVLEEVGGFPEGEPMGEDQDLWVRIAYRYSMAFSRRVSAFYLQDAENRACITNPPNEECPFSQRLLVAANNSNDPRKRDMLRLTANHILHIAQLNILAGNDEAALVLLRDSRTRLLPLKRLKWEIKRLLK
ncbi:putative glycosyltransferase EpsJ [Zhongshania aliphaticivorans]|uniref:Putative glycosyltransferase EpsJ n=1 Tax=Zhongshania aliphaticivorans TaxID=1470434 RepID=A0A5S9Q9Q6_9GAMM|nr:glycosyltransferase family A protein [Zhongshania aliphaticivorans]CAA0086991.1 putative glycosyltransferase EpsJ [Zhongshania aliphaticivorans]CAA0113865.1 putative glycosyltransferase EpsJ [Zhongshania aliphaticivorans]